jgi:hypothetical protein
MIYSPDSKQGLEVWVDADFYGGWDPGDTENADNVYSWTGVVLEWQLGEKVFPYPAFYIQIVLPSSLIQ